MSETEKTEVNLRQFKGHHRKFPWALIIRLLVMGISVALIFFLVKYIDEIQDKRAIPAQNNEIEIEITP